MSATLAIVHQTKLGSLYQLSQVIRGAEASLTIIEAQSILATATDDLTKSAVTKAIFDATLNLKSLELEENPYGTFLKLLPNCVFAGVFFVLLVLHTGLMTWLRFWYFGICLIIGCALEFAGYLTRSLAVYDDTNPVYFLIQIISITVAPAFTMAAIYYLLGKLIVVHGRTYSLLKPIWYSYIFILCDVISLGIQAAGGAMAAGSVVQYENPQKGTHVMEAGIAFQVFSMTLFLWFWFDFLFRIYFYASPDLKFNFKTLCSLILNGKRAEFIRKRKLEPYYDPDYQNIRDRKFFNYFPVFFTILTLLIYVRCIYRLIELSQGWTGFLITHEVYIMCLDALMVAITSFICVVFHPALFLGRSRRLPLRERKIQDNEFQPPETSNPTATMYQQQTPHFEHYMQKNFCSPSPSINLTKGVAISMSIYLDKENYSDYLDTLYLKEYSSQKDGQCNYYSARISPPGLPNHLYTIPSSDSASVSSEFHFN